MLGPAVASAFDKIAGVLSRDLLTLLDAMKEIIGVRTPGTKLDGMDSLHSGEGRERDVDPYHLTYFDGGLYLSICCHKSKDVRLFAAERIHAHLTPAPPARPSGSRRRR